MRTDSYIYKHFNPLTGECFYVGIGTGEKFHRAHTDKNRNAYWTNTVKKYGKPIVEIFAKGLTKDAACEMEIAEIKKHGRKMDGGTLVNLSLGGENSLYGIPRTKEHSNKISKANIGRIISAETRKKQSEVAKGRKITPETIEKIRLKNLGKKRSPEVIAKFIKAKRGVSRPPQTQEHIEKRRLSGGFAGACKSIVCWNNNKVYRSAKEASIDLSISDKHIGSICKGNRTHTQGFKFSYAL